MQLSSTNQNKFLLFHGDAEDILDYRNGYIKEGTVDCIFTDPTPSRTDLIYADINKLCRIFNKAKRILKPTGCILVVMADFHDEKGSLELTPFTFAKQMKERHGWTVRSELIWYRPVEALEAYSKQEDRNRFMRDHDFIFLFTQGRYGYYFNEKMLNFPLRSCFSMSKDKVEPGEFATPFPKRLIAEVLHILCPLKVYSCRNCNHSWT